MGSDLVERAAVLEMLANHSADALDGHLIGIRSLRGDLGWAIRALPTAEPERADVGTLERVLCVCQAKLREVEAVRDKLNSSLDTCCEELGIHVSWAMSVDVPNAVRALKAERDEALAKLREVEAERDEARAALEADLAREREAHEEAERNASSLFDEVKRAQKEAFEANARADAARAEVERLRAELTSAKGHEAAPAALADNVLRFAPPGPVTLTACQRAELLAVVERDRLPVKVDEETLARILWEAVPGRGVWSALRNEVRRDWHTSIRAVAQAFARAMLTPGAIAAVHREADSSGYDIDRDDIPQIICAALDHAGLHVAAEPVAAEPVADESDAEVMLAAVREKMAPEHVAAFDAARAAVTADAERTRGVLTGALDKAKRLRVDPAKAAALPRASIGLPAPAAELVVDAAISRADVTEERAARMEAVKSQHERPDTTWHSFDEYVAGVRACPWEERRDNIAAAIRMVHKANEPHSSAIHAVTIALEQLALAVDEVRRLGGGGR